MGTKKYSGSIIVWEHLSFIKLACIWLSSGLKPVVCCCFTAWDLTLVVKHSAEKQGTQVVLALAM